MPVHSRFTDGGRGFVITHTGAVIGDDVLRVIEQIFFSRDLVTEPIFHGLIDVHGTSSVTLSTEDVKKVADRQVTASRQMPETATVIAVYAEDTVIFGLARMWEVLVHPSGWETQVFSDRTEAVAWLKGRVADRFGFDANLE
jgi:hypothetical protein